MLEENHIAGPQPETMAVLVGVFRCQPPVPGLCDSIKANTDLFPCWVLWGSQWVWLLFGSSGCSVVQVLGGWRCPAFLWCIWTLWGQLSLELGLLSGVGVVDATGINCLVLSNFYLMDHQLCALSAGCI